MSAFIYFRRSRLIYFLYFLLLPPLMNAISRLSPPPPTPKDTLHLPSPPSLRSKHLLLRLPFPLPLLLPYLFPLNSPNILQISFQLQYSILSIPRSTRTSSFSAPAPPTSEIGCSWGMMCVGWVDFDLCEGFVGRISAEEW